MFSHFLGSEGSIPIAVALPLGSTAEQTSCDMEYPLWSVWISAVLAVVSFKVLPTASLMVMEIHC